MASDLEARIIRLEQIVAGIPRQITNVRATAGQVIQSLSGGGGTRGWGDGQPTTYFDPTCSTTLSSTATVHYTLAFGATGSFTINWDGTQFIGCGTVPWAGPAGFHYVPGTPSIYNLSGAAVASYAVTTPLYITAVPSGSSWNITVGMALAASTTQVFATNHALGLTGDTGYVAYYLPQSASCGGTPSFTYSNTLTPTCTPWKLTVPDPASGNDQNTQPTISPPQPPYNWHDPTVQGFVCGLTITSP